MSAIPLVSSEPCVNCFVFYHVLNSHTQLRATGKPIKFIFGASESSHNQVPWYFPRLLSHLFLDFSLFKAPGLILNLLCTISPSAFQESCNELINQVMVSLQDKSCHLCIQIKCCFGKLRCNLHAVKDTYLKNGV